LLTSVGVYFCQFLGGQYILVGLANYNILREICLGRLSGEEAKGWLAMFEAAGSGIPDGKLQKQLELIPLRLDTEKAEKV
jgi:truncated hemoglobin YjbI